MENEVKKIDVIFGSENFNLGFDMVGKFRVSMKGYAKAADFRKNRKTQARLGSDDVVKVDCDEEVKGDDDL